MSYSNLRDRHRRFMDSAVSSITNPDLSLNDKDILIKNHQFVRDDDTDRKLCTQSWEIRMARRYYDKLFKEYALVDLSRYKENKIGMRWRNKNEVIEGKGQFSCGSNSCYIDNSLLTYEVPFKYKEDGILKHELVKVRLCEECAKQLFYQKLKEMKRALKHKVRVEDAGSDSKRQRREESIENGQKCSTITVPDPLQSRTGLSTTKDNNSTLTWLQPPESTMQPTDQDRMASYFDELLL